jgi:hypothetical protein
MSKATGNLPLIVIVIVITNQDITSSRLLPGSSYIQPGQIDYDDDITPYATWKAG